MMTLCFPDAEEEERLHCTVSVSTLRVFRVLIVPSNVAGLVLLLDNKRGQSSSSEVEVWVLTITLFSSTLTVSRFSLISLLCLPSPGLGSSPSPSREIILQRKLQRPEKSSPRQEHPQSPATMLHI